MSLESSKTKNTKSFKNAVFEKTDDGYCINPKTKVQFKFNDEYNSWFFLGYRKRNNMRVPYFGTVSEVTRRKKHWIAFSRKSRNGKTRTLPGVSGKLLEDAKRRAGSENVEVTNTWIKNEIEKGWILDGKKILDFQIQTEGNKKRCAYSPSLDRIDNSNRKYTYQNSRLIPTLLNIALNSWKEEDFLNIVGPYIDYLRKLREIKSDEENRCENRKRKRDDE